MILNKVYVCSPLAAPTDEGIRQNMNQAKVYMKELAEKLQCRAIAPHAFLPEFLDDNIPEERALGMDTGLRFLETCDAIVICGDRISKGMDAEIKHAIAKGITVLVYIGDTPDTATPKMATMDMEIKIRQGAGAIDLHIREEVI